MSIPTYTMSCFKLPITLCDELGKLMSHFWWGQRKKEKKIHWVSWNSMCKPKGKVEWVLRTFMLLIWLYSHHDPNMDDASWPKPLLCCTKCLEQSIFLIPALWRQRLAIPHHTHREVYYMHTSYSKKEPVIGLAQVILLSYGLTTGCRVGLT